MEQRAVARLAHVKVRLGNLNAGGVQKGVDTLLRTDLETLARHGAISDAFLLGGDEDLLSAVEGAQAFGVCVHLWGVEPRFGMNQSERLVWEADTTHTLGADLLRPFVRAVERPAETPAPGPADSPGRDDAAPPPVECSDDETRTAGDVAAAAAARHGAPLPSEVFGRRQGPPALPATVSASRQPDLGPDLDDVRIVGEHVAHTWLVTRGRDNLADLLPGPMLAVGHRPRARRRRGIGAGPVAAAVGRGPPGAARGLLGPAVPGVRHPGLTGRAGVSSVR